MGTEPRRAREPAGATRTDRRTTVRSSRTSRGVEAVQLYAEIIQTPRATHTSAVLRRAGCNTCHKHLTTHIIIRSITRTESSRDRRHATAESAGVSPCTSGPIAGPHTPHVALIMSTCHKPGRPVRPGTSPQSPRHRQRARSALLSMPGLHGGDECGEWTTLLPRDWVLVSSS